jgi:hypothetical protein
MGAPMACDQAKHRVRSTLRGSGRYEQRKCHSERSASSGSYSGLRDEIAAGGINRRADRWHAMHAASSGHLDSRPFLARVRAGAEVTSFPSACF